MAKKFYGKLTIELPGEQNFTTQTPLRGTLTRTGTLSAKFKTTSRHSRKPSASVIIYDEADHMVPDEALFSVIQHADGKHEIRGKHTDQLANLSPDFDIEVTAYRIMRKHLIPFLTAIKAELNAK